MKYQELWIKENTRVQERYDLATERLAGIAGTETGKVPDPFAGYFVRMAQFAGMIEKLARRQLRDELEGLTLEELQELNQSLYADILPENYGHSYANPDYAAEALG